jgi:hypothetical protein
MATFDFRATSEKPAEELLAFFADMTNAKGWDPSITKAVRLDDGPVGLGSRFEVTLRALGRDLVLTYEITEHRPPGKVVLRAESGLFTSEDTITLTPVGEGRTEVHYQARLSGKGLTVLFDPAFKLSINHFGNQAGKELAARL